MLIRRIILSMHLFITAALAGNTVGLISQDPDKAYQGYTLFAPTISKTAYLIDMEGRQVHRWNLKHPPGLVVYLLPEGHLLATGLVVSPDFHGGGKGGVVQEFDWDGNLVWEFSYISNKHCQHHDLERMPDGNTLIIAWEYKSKSEAIQAGRNPALLKDEELWADHLIEVDLNGNVVWEWHVWDHVIQDYNSFRSNYGSIADHPELVDLNYVKGEGPEDWNHINSVDYNPELDQILLSVHEFNEIWIIEHSETSEIAVGHTGGKYGRGGDLLYRWGNPQTYRAGSNENQKLFQQHDARWIEPGLNGEGHILAFNNGWFRRPTEYASIDEIAPPLGQNGTYTLSPGSAYGPLKLSWSYVADPPESFKSNYISGAQRLPNGNTLICVGATGRFFEVTHTGTVVWEYINPVTDKGIVAQGDKIQIRAGRSSNPVFRCTRFTKDGPELSGRELIPGTFIEIYPTSEIAGIETHPDTPVIMPNYPDPFNLTTSIRYILPQTQKVNVSIYDVTGRMIDTLVNETQSAGNHLITFNGSSLTSGLYICVISTDHWTAQEKLILMK